MVSIFLLCGDGLEQQGKELYLFCIPIKKLKDFALVAKQSRNIDKKEWQSLLGIFREIREK